VLATLEASARLADALSEERRPLLRHLARSIQPLPTLRTRLDMSLDPAGQLLDSASPALGGLRRARRIAYERLRSRLDQLVHGSDASALQEPIITLRNGRYVVPVRSDARGRVKGIVHDQSGSGQTLFVEPLIAVELGQRVARGAARGGDRGGPHPRRAVGHVGAAASALRETLGALARFDLWAAKARFAAELDATRAETSERAEVGLIAARHPGLSGRVVPIDLRLGREYTAVVITGRTRAARPSRSGRSVCCL
jgi:DNA mismatch repair protein MutS2